ncbi:MAG TPA: ergothioneine biosynthesis protein EgtB [Saprospiraceae bacterium]|nr:ergothioneine biosynthesis protein EgtB [Saprospiraceae bacterium]HMQ85758.1 ergothioneine biosynthesis protein EgtB [Saprospiraceae bacterium]
MTSIEKTPIHTALILRYENIRAQSLAICQPLQEVDYLAQPVVFVSPPKWHLGHTTWFFENFILQVFATGYQPFNPSLHYCFNSYYESQGPRILRSKRGNLIRPSLEEVLAYRKHVDQHLTAWLCESVLDGEVLQLLEVGLQHEQQHQELLVTDIKYSYGHNPLYPVYCERKPEQPPAPASLRFLDMAEGIYNIGYQGTGFCWDNELSAHKVYLHDYAIANRTVTNGEYLEFIENGGYSHFEYWLEEGWAWVKQQELKAPMYWFRENDTWFHYTLSGIRPLDLNLPLTHINYYEADAYARFREMRLPTEQEWEAACLYYQPEASTSSNLLESGLWHPTSVHTGDFQFLGNVWEWTGSAYLPYPSYPRFKGALGEYNGKFMVNQMVLRGGSCATPREHIRPTYRNFFHADEGWQFTGIRLAQ